jgi:hypothetical protein
LKAFTGPLKEPRRMKYIVQMHEGQLDLAAFRVQTTDRFRRSRTSPFEGDEAWIYLDPGMSKLAYEVMFKFSMLMIR